MDIKVDISNVCISVDELTLRPFRETDRDDLFAYASVRGVGEAAGWLHHKSKDETLYILREFIRDKNVLAIEKDGHVIGSVGFHTPWTEKTERYAPLRATEIGYVLSKDYWGRGIMTRVVKAVLNFCFEELDVDAVAVTHFTQNERSRRVIEKCGFKHVDAVLLEAPQLRKAFRTDRYILYKK